MEPNYYQILGVSARARPDDIQAAFERLARLHSAQPGRMTERQFNQVLDAYSTLKDAQARQAYDRTLNLPKAAAPAWPPVWWPFRRAKQAPVLLQEKPQPTFTQLLDFDWEALEGPPKESPAQRKAIVDEFYFKAAVIAIVVAVVVLIFFALRA